MSDGLGELNALDREEAERRLYTAFAHHGWAHRVAAKRPYRDMQALDAAAEAAWDELAPEDWLLAFQAHPRIGERGGHAPAVSDREQRRVAEGAGETLAALARENQRYEARFGHVFLIAAAGRSAEEILLELRRRMTNDAAAELGEAVREQRRITLMRLQGMVDA